jgi:DNA-binding response OmpR family regulator
VLGERQVVSGGPDETFGPLVVGFVVREGAPPPDQFASELEREAIQLAPAAFPIPGSPPSTPEVRIVLVWLPAGVPSAELADVAAWRERAAVVGCAPTGTNADSERALAAGFDDFVAGRAAPREMARRLRAVERRTRRSSARGGRRERFGRIRLDADQHRLWVDGQRVALTRTELAVMTALVDAGGQIRTRADILLKAWGDEGLEVGERAVDNIIMRLRRKLPHPDLIVTVRGVGFRLADG